MEVEAKSRKFLLVLAFLVIILIVFIYNWFKYGTTGVFNVVQTLITTVVWIGILGIVLFVLYMLFLWEKKINANIEVYRAITSESKISKPDNLGNVWTSGDEKHRPKLYGKIIGYSHRQNFKGVVNGKNKKKYYQVEDCFLVRLISKGFLSPVFDFFKSPIIIRCPEDMHDSLQGDVHIKAVSLVKHGMYFFPDAVHLDFDAIDHTIYYESERFIQLDVIGKIAPLISKAVGISKTDLAMLEGKTGMEMLKAEKERLR